MNVVIVDDHPLVRQGLVSVLSLDTTIHVTGQEGNIKDACRSIQEVSPDVALVDLRLSDGCGLDIINYFKQKGSKCKFVILTSSIEEEDFIKANELNVDGYILKEAFPEEIISAIKLVCRGRKYFDPSLVELTMRRDKKGPVDNLTPREREVLMALSQGLCNRDIGKQLYITDSTVKKHISQILAKLGLTDRTQAALYATSKRIG